MRIKRMMMDKKEIKLVIASLCILAAVFLITSCGSAGTSTGTSLGTFFGPKKLAAEPNVNYRTGSDGITVKFVDKMPPSEIRENSAFGVGVNLENKGATEVKGAILILSGYSKNLVAFNLDQGVQRTSKESIDLEGKSPFNPSGSKDMAFFDGKTKTVDISKKEDTVVFMATVCYPYQTVASTSICVVSDMANLVSAIKPACTPKDVITLSSQGAPVSVTKIESSMFTDESKLNIKLRFYISNQQKGSIRAKNFYYKDCKGPALDKEDINKVDIEAYIGNDRMSCPSSINVVEKADTSYAECTATIDKMQQNYLSTVRAVLDYGYVYTESKEMKIKKI